MTRIAQRNFHEGRAEFTLCHLQPSRHWLHIGHLTHMELANPTHADANPQSVTFGDYPIEFSSGCENEVSTSGLQPVDGIFQISVEMRSLM